jgi:predicted TIM-barrel fold metal-dependent hydrolase
MANTTFDPGQHLTKIKGQDYLEVKWRIAWLRAEHPDAVLTTELHSHEAGRAIFSAHVQIPDGGTATGWGSETMDTFENYIEKAETKAIGRALAAVGFGTQFCDDFNDTGAIADAPVSFGRTSGQSQAGEGSLATSAQKSMIQYKARQAQLEPDELVQFIQQQTGKAFNDLTKREASRVIDALGVQPSGPQPMRKAS